jgi:hypothetical protein
MAPHTRLREREREALERLRAAGSKYDPDGLFQANHELS